MKEHIQSGKVNIHPEHLVYNEETKALYVEEQREDAAVEIQVYSPDTDVFVLALKGYPDLCANVFFFCHSKRAQP